MLPVCDWNAEVIIVYDDDESQRQAYTLRRHSIEQAQAWCKAEEARLFRQRKFRVKSVAIKANAFDAGMNFASSLNYYRER